MKILTIPACTEQIIALGTYIHQVAEEIAEIIRSNLKYKVRLHLQYKMCRST